VHPAAPQSWCTVPWRSSSSTTTQSFPLASCQSLRMRLAARPARTLLPCQVDMPLPPWPLLPPPRIAQLSCLRAVLCLFLLLGCCYDLRSELLKVRTSHTFPHWSCLTLGVLIWRYVLLYPTLCITGAYHDCTCPCLRRYLLSGGRGGLSNQDIPCALRLELQRW
jgi:hypothetical protein